MKGILKNNSILIFVALFILSSVLSNSFLSVGNIFNLLRQLTPLALASIGMLLVINTGGIDLSVGSIAGAGGLLVALSLPHLAVDGGPACFPGWPCRWFWALSWEQEAGYW